MHGSELLKEVGQNFSHTRSCVLTQVDIQSVGMTQIAIVTKWKFVVEFEDWETGEILGTTGQADTREDCEGMIEYDMQFHTDCGRAILNVEAGEICAECEGDGQIPIGNGGRVICPACDGHLGPISKMMIRL